MGRASGLACAGFENRRRRPSEGGRRKTSRMFLKRYLSASVALIPVRVGVRVMSLQRRPADSRVNGKKNAGGGASRLKRPNK